MGEDTEPGDYFGGAVAMSGSHAVVGARRDADHGGDSGSAYVFDISDPAGPVQVAKLVGEDSEPGDYFGSAVGVSGTVVLIGAPGDDDSGLQAGSACLFDVMTGEQLAKLLAAEQRRSMGFSVAIESDTAVLGAPESPPTGTGDAFLFNDGCACPADVNGDGALNILDFVEFQLLWQAGDLGADCDANGAFDVLDFVCFQRLFVEGCP